MKKNSTREGVLVPKMTVMQPTVVNVDGPSENVATEGLICAHEDPSYFQRCGSYNTLYCKIECSEYADRKRMSAVSRDPEDELNIEPGR